MPESLLTFLKLAFLALLWLFFLRVLRAVWAELKEPAVTPAVAAAPVAARSGWGRGAQGPTAGSPGQPSGLKVLEPAEERGRVFPLADEMTVGRGGGCGVSLPGDRMVSQLHARVFWGPAGDLFVEDLGSTNGTLLNQAKVSGPTRMKKGDRLQVGHTVMEVAG